MTPLVPCNLLVGPSVIAIGASAEARVRDQRCCVISAFAALAANYYLPDVFCHLKYPGIKHWPHHLGLTVR